MPRTPVTRAPRGRPRDPAVEDKVASAVLDVLAGSGFHGLTVEEVARRSGVSKPTLYARWPTKGELVVAALTRSVPPLVPVDAGDPAERLIAFVSGFLVSLSHWAGGRAVLALHAQATHEPELNEALLRDYWGPRVDVLGAAIADARAAGVLSEDVDDATVRDLLFGPSLYRWLVTGSPITAEVARKNVTAALAGLGVRNGFR